MNTPRTFWVSHVTRLALPVLGALAERRLKQVMPVETNGGPAYRAQFTHLEAFGRLLCGLAPWLEVPSEDTKEEGEYARFAALAQAAMDAATDPHSPDFCNWTEGLQPVVDAAFLAQAVLRAPRTLWHGLDGRVQKNLASCLAATRVHKPHFNNWLLFSATIEAALHHIGADWDKMRVDFALRQHAQWHVGDGAYSDGPQFHWDYYNAFVIHPMLVDIITELGSEEEDWEKMRAPIFDRARRFAAVQERTIAPDGLFAPVGRSLTYRCGAFHLLAQSALRRDLPDGVSPAQVRDALSAVIGRTLDAPGTWDENGWLRVGLCGHQPGLGEPYISTGSLYLCAAAFLPLGLPTFDPFWAAPPADWTAKKIWAGQDALPDHAL